MTAPLYRDPVHDGATDPVLVQHRGDGRWWLLYTQRRPGDPGAGVEWVHGTDIGVAVSDDGGATFTPRGVLDLADRPERDTFWAPEVLWAAGEYHLYVTVVRGVPAQWSGHERHVVHYVSDDLERWRRIGPVPLSSDRVIDACVAALPGGGWRMWFKDEAHGSHTWAADSGDLYAWHVVGPVVTDRPHEGPNVFTLGGWHWMLVDEWRGQGVDRSADMSTWERDGIVLDRPGTRTDDGSVGLHADVVVADDDAYVVYFTHPGRSESRAAGAAVHPGADAGAPAADAGDVAVGAEVSVGPMRTAAERRSAVQVARLRVVDGHLVCDRDEDVTPALPLSPPPTG